ncbi:YidB family protein [Crenobacter oryzisoli]|uniref:YidB family protein n=1 Tax=Crenobacter oryzisoli TaxID=3056844 RepID=UPI003F496197
MLGASSFWCSANLTGDTMGLLDQLTGMLSGGGGEGQGGVAGAVSSLLESQGGVAGLVEKFQQGGLGDVVASWVGTGENQPVSADQIQQVLGSEQVNALASQLGLDPQQLSQGLSEYLPQVIDKLTPNGQVPEGGGDLLSQGLDLVKGLFHKG